MATVRQAKLAKAIVENSKRNKPLNKKELLVSVGYAPSTADVKQGEIMEQKGVKEELEILGFSEHAAKRVVEEIMHNPEVDPSARLKATDQVFKVHGTYAPEKSIVANIQVSEDKRNKANGLIDSILGN